MKFKEKLKKIYRRWFTKQQPESKPKTVEEQAYELLGQRESGVIILCSKEEVNIYTGAKSEEEVVKLLLDLTFSDYFVRVYSFFESKYPNLANNFSNRLNEIYSQQKERQENILELDNEDDPIISPLSLGNQNK